MFTLLDWAVVVAYLAFTTWLGGKLAGKQQTLRDFFLGGRKLPWTAVAGSIIATEISAVSFVGVPALVFAAGGNFAYLQLGIGTILARVIVGYWFVPAFYEREIYSPYDYMEQRLGPRVKSVITGLFIVGQLLGQGVRVYLTALVLQVVTDGRLSLDASIWIIGAISILWTILGGMATVIWTDVILFLLFLGGAIISLAFVLGHIPGGWGELAAAGSAAGKFRVFDFSLDPTLEFTFWAGIIATTWGSLNAYGTDQLLAQRMFCCRGAREARKAVIGSSVGLVVAFTLLVTGVGLYGFYLHRARAKAEPQAARERLEMLAAHRILTGDEAREVHALVVDHAFEPRDAALMKENRNRVFPIFIVREIPPGLTGLIVAAIFAAAVSSMDSILAALSQTFVSAFYLPWRARRGGSDDRRQIVVSRILVVVFGVALCGMAYVGILASKRYPDILNLALSMAGYTGGALLAGFMLAFLGLRVDDRGLVWSAPLSVVAVFGVAWKAGWASWAVAASSAILLGLWIVLEARRRPWLKTAVFSGAIAVPLLLHWALPVAPAWPWFIPIGSIVAFGFGWLLAEPRSAAPAGA